MNAYAEDLAHIHDAGFGMIARGAAGTLLDALSAGGFGPADGPIVELACGSGISSSILAGAGYAVRGFDLSPEMIELARGRVTGATFDVRSLYDVPIEKCVAVTAIGEAFNYRFDARAGFDAMTAVFERAHEALVPGGFLLFDVAQPGRVLPRAEHTVWAGDGWRVGSEVIEHSDRRMLTRRIVSFRETANGERRSEEIHELALYDQEEVFAALREIGFSVRTLATYAGEYHFSAGHGGFLGMRARVSEQ